MFVSVFQTLFLHSLITVWGSEMMTGENAFKGENIIITGGSSGIGKAAAQAFIMMGAHVTIAARHEYALQQSVEEIQSNVVTQNPQIDYAVLDVGNDEKVSELADKYNANHGSPYIIINSAGTADAEYFEEMSKEVFDKVITVNLHGTINMCRSFIPLMKHSGGHIVNISSMAGLIGIFGYSAYSTTKFALIGFSQSLRCEMKRYNINVSVLCPPSVDTPMMAMLEKAPKETQAIETSGGLILPAEVVKAMINGIRKKRFLIIPGTTAKFLYMLTRFTPWLTEWYIDGIVKKNQWNERRVVGG